MGQQSRELFLFLNYVLSRNTSNFYLDSPDFSIAFTQHAFCLEIEEMSAVLSTLSYFIDHVYGFDSVFSDIMTPLSHLRNAQ